MKTYNVYEDEYYPFYFIDLSNEKKSSEPDFQVNLTDDDYQEYKKATSSLYEIFKKIETRKNET